MAGSQTQRDEVARERREATGKPNDSPRCSRARRVPLLGGCYRISAGTAGVVYRVNVVTGQVCVASTAEIREVSFDAFKTGKPDQLDHCSGGLW